MVAENDEFYSHVRCFGFTLHSAIPARVSSIPGPGLDERDAAFMQHLRNLAQEALTWSHLNDEQRLMWATVLELNVVPLQEQQRNLLFWVGRVGQFKEFAVIGK